MQTLSPIPASSHGKPVDSFAQAIELEKALLREVRGEVRFDRGSRAMYATDGSNYRQIPIGLVVPRDAEDVKAAIAVCRKYGAPVLARGAGTSLAGQCCNVAVVLDFTKYMNRILELECGAKICAGAAGRGSGHAAQPGRAPPVDVCARSFNSQSMHDRRNDRQQFLRHAFAAWRQDRG